MMAAYWVAHLAVWLVGTMVALRVGLKVTGSVAQMVESRAALMVVYWAVTKVVCLADWMG